MLRRQTILIRDQDIILILFIAYGLLSVFLTSLIGFSMMKGFREFALFIPYLFYFPVREYIQETKRYKPILWTLIFVGTVVALVNVIRYREAIAIANYLFEVWGKRQVVEEPLYMGAIVILLSLVILIQRKYHVFLLIMLSVNIFSLAVTFSRGYWMATIFASCLLIILNRSIARSKLIITIGVLCLIGVSVTIIIFPGIFQSFGQGIMMRVASIGVNDISLRTRLSEARTVIRLIYKSPIVGYGLGSMFSYYDLITKYYVTNWYIHNGYLFLLFKFGIIGTILFLIYYIKQTLNCYHAFRNETNNDLRPVFIGFFSISITMLLLSFTSPQFYDRASVLLLSTIWGLNDGLTMDHEHA